MNFPVQFHEWLSSALLASVPDQVAAFSFNLFEPALVEGVRFGVELVGAENFDPEDSDWACEEIWAAEPRELHIPVAFSGEDWEECLQKMNALLQSELEHQGGASSVLKSRRAVALGFVDGDLQIVWSSEPNNSVNRTPKLLRSLGPLRWRSGAGYFQRYVFWSFPSVFI